MERQRSASGMDRKHKFQEALEGVLSDQTKPSAEGDLLRDVKVDILDFRPTSQHGKRVEPRRSRRSARSARSSSLELVCACFFCTVLHHEHIRRGAWFLHDLSDDASQLSSVHDTLGVQASCLPRGRTSELLRKQLT